MRQQDRKSTRLNSSQLVISYAVFCLKKKKMGKSFFVIQVVIKAFPVDSFRRQLHEIIARSSCEQSLTEKRAFCKRLTAVLDEQVPAFEHGFWDLIRGGRAEEELEEWSSELEGALATEKEELGQAPDEINRISAEKRYEIGRAHV